jgi:two-component system sensor histidine kinase HydH
VSYVAVMVLLTAREMLRGADAGGTVERARRRYLAVGAVATMTLGILGRAWLGGTAAALGDLAVMLYVFFLSQVILRDRLLDLHEFLGRMVVLAVLALLFAAISGLLIAIANTPAGQAFSTLVSVIILLTLYEPLKDKLEAKSIELFFRERYGLTHLLDQLRRTMIRAVDPGRMGKLVVDTLYDERRCTHAAIYLLVEPLGHGFRLEAFRGAEPAPWVNERHLTALWHAIQRHRAPLLAEQLLREQEEGQDTPKRDLVAAMRAVSADVLLPFVSGDRVLGFLGLRDDRVPEPYSTAEIALLMSVADTAVSVIETSELNRRLRERERLAAIGEMAAGLAHEIRNPLGAIKGAAEYLDPDLAVDPESREFLQVIIDESNRLNGVVSQFLDYARPFRAQLSPCDVNDVVRKTAKLIAAREQLDQPRLELELDPDMPPIELDAEQIKQVILNLVLNAIDATGSAAEPVTITTRAVPERERIEIRVKDRGPGISAEALDHIFIPFFTTKQNGTGLGLAVCQRIITSHGGEIRPQSTLGEGTEFVIRLPTRRRGDKSITGSFTGVGVLDAPRPGPPSDPAGGRGDRS